MTGITFPLFLRTSPLDPAGVAVLPEGKAVRRFRDNAVIGIPDHGIVQAGHVQNVSLSGTVCVDGGSKARLFNFFTKSDGVVCELFAADIVDPGDVFGLDLRVKDYREGSF